jgi:hypothetical protein
MERRVGRLEWECEAIVQRHGDDVGVTSVCVDAGMNDRMGGCRRGMSTMVCLPGSSLSAPTSLATLARHFCSRRARTPSLCPPQPPLARSNALRHHRTPLAVAYQSMIPKPRSPLSPGTDPGTTTLGAGRPSRNCNVGKQNIHCSRDSHPCISHRDGI